MPDIAWVSGPKTSVGPQNAPPPVKSAIREQTSYLRDMV